MSSIDPKNPIAWVSEDRILLNDVTRHGLHRKVIARKYEPMDVELWLNSVQNDAGENKVSGWLVEREGFFYLWLVWKDKL